MRVRLLLSAGCLAVAAFAVAVGTSAASSASGLVSSRLLVNGDFQTGDLTGWTTFQTTNGVAEISVVPFHTANARLTSYSAELGVGQSVFEGFDVQRGGGIFQTLNLDRGFIFLSARIAADHPYDFCNGDGGKVQMLVDGVVIDEHSFGAICSETTYATLRGNFIINKAGEHELRFLVTRGGLLSGVRDYLDDITLVGTACKGGDCAKHPYRALP